MTEATEQKHEPMTKVDLMVAMSLLLSEFESHPDNKDTFWLRMAFKDDGQWEHSWEHGAFVLDTPDLPGEDN